MKFKNRTKIDVRFKSMKEIIEDCKVWASEIEKEFSPDLIIFIAQSGYLFADPLSKYFGCDLADVIVSRPANHKKDKLKKIINIIPQWMVAKAISSPINYTYNRKISKRNIKIPYSFKQAVKNGYEKILIVDDSVDTGFTLFEVEKIIQKNFPNSEIKKASYSVISYSEDKIQVDFWRYKNTLIFTATSRRSKENSLFLKNYQKWAIEHDKELT